MLQPHAVLALLIFLSTVTLVIWRPKGVHEMIPAILGGAATLVLGLTGWPDVHRISVIVSNAAITIISTFAMSSVLDNVGFFRWTAVNLARRAGGDGMRLWVYVLLLALGMTLFLNNDGSILIATPIICELTKELGFDRAKTTPYILGSALIATAASAPIGVSNPANLEAMALAGFNLTTHAEYMFLPSIMGLSACFALLWWRFRRVIPASYPLDSLPDPTVPTAQAPPAAPAPPPRPPHHPHPPGGLPPHLHGPHHPPGHPPRPPVPPRGGGAVIKDPGLMRLTVAVVVLVRLGYFVASMYHVPTSVVALAGAVVVVMASLSRRSVSLGTVIKQSPWHILLFAFGMELVVFGLRNTGVIGALGSSVAAELHNSLIAVVVIPGTAIGILSCLMNNHPALIAGTLTLTGLGLKFIPLKLAYTGAVLGSDILSLLTPMGTLASLLWFHLIHRQGLRFTWGEYMATSLRVIPLSFGFALVGLYLWALLVTR